MKWQPIESAPKDGSGILALQYRKVPCFVFWNGESWDDGDFHDRVVGITHWMPLPEPPEGE